MTTPNFEDAERELQRVEEIERKKMHDRTRAIVEAAERLADSPSEHELLHVCDECRERLFALRVALALPSPQWTRTPPSEPGWWFWRLSSADPIKVAEVATGHASRPDGKGDFEYIEGLCAFFHGLEEFSTVDDTGGEWFPVRIEEPPA